MAGEAPEPDSYPGAPHPRMRHDLIGHSEAEASFLEGWRSGQLHHAWLLAGPEGVGKATFAYRAARFLLAHPPQSSQNVASHDVTSHDVASHDVASHDVASLAVDPDSRAARQTMMLSHPDLYVLRRRAAADGKKAATEIKIEDVREALRRFMSTSSTGGWRIIIIDAVEDMNRSGTNAILKMLEEPPANAVFFVISHSPGRLLPTIRSRCRVLRFRPLMPESVSAVVKSLGEPWSSRPVTAILTAAQRSEGSVRRTLDLLDPTTAKLIAQVEGMLARQPSFDLMEVLALAEKLAGRDGEGRFSTTLHTVFDWLAAKVEEGATWGPRRLAPLVEVWEKISAEVQEAEAYNLDRRPLVISIFDDISDAVRRSVGETA